MSECRTETAADAVAEECVDSLSIGRRNKSRHISAKTRTKKGKDIHSHGQLGLMSESSSPKLSFEPAKVAEPPSDHQLNYAAELSDVTLKHVHSRRNRQIK